MPSPFPGMNPYLERDVVWHDFHERFLILGAGVIGAQVRPNFIVRVDDHLYVHELPDGPRIHAGRADLGITPAPRQASSVGDVAVIEPPTRLRVPPVDVTREAYLEIIDRRSRKVVTVIELLSPSNKRSSSIDRAQYLAKRATVMESGANLVEIDLLRGGAPPPVEDRPECCYSVLVGRVDESPDVGFWPIALRDRLPTIPIPLHPPHPDARLDLQELLNRVYDEAGYEYDVYDGPPQPPLSEQDAEWARQFVPSGV